MDYSEIADSIAKTIDAAATPLTQTQKTLLAGAVAVWIEKSVELEREACAELCDEEASCEGIAQRCAEKIRMRG